MTSVSNDSAAAAAHPAPGIALSVNWFDTVQESQVLAGQREFRGRLSDAGIPHEFREEPGGRVFRPNMFVLDLDGIIARLRPASSSVAV